MKKIALMLMVIGVVLSIAGTAMAATSGGVTGINSVAACVDSVTVAVSGTSSAAWNRVRVRVYVQDNKGVYRLRQQAVSDTFGSGDFLVPITVDFSNKPVSAGTTLQIEAQLQGGGGGSIGSPITIYAQAADQSCAGRCSVTISTSDRVPANGTITVRSHFGSWFRPEGWTHAALPVYAGQYVRDTVAGVRCDSTVRVWYYPATGRDRTPKMLPSQYWPYSEYGASTDDGAIPYATSFAKGLRATMPLESDDPYRPK